MQSASLRQFVFPEAYSSGVPVKRACPHPGR
jgi:hypothetical protein